MKKILLSLLIIVLFLGCKNKEEDGKITVYVPNGPPSIPILLSAELNPNIDVVMYNDVQSEVIPKILKTTDFLFIIPTNIAAKLYNSKVDIRMLGIVSNGFVEIITQDQINSVADLSGKDISISAAGSSPDVISRFIFSKYSVKPNINYSSSPEIAGMFIAGKIKTAVIPEPQATIALQNTKGSGSKLLSDLNEEYFKITGKKGIPQVCICSGNDFFKKNKDSIDKIISSYKESTDYTLTNKKAAALFGIKKLKLKMDEDNLSESIARMNLCFIDAGKAKPELTIYYESLLSIDPKSIGEKLPDDKFYGL